MSNQRRIEELEAEVADLRRRLALSLERVGAQSHIITGMVEIDLPDGTTVEVGWTPEHDPAGSYRIVVFRDCWDDQVEVPILTQSLERVVAALQDVVRRRAPGVS